MQLKLKPHQLGGELHCDLVKIKTMINSSLFFLRRCEVFGLERLFVCFVIVGYSFPEERSRASNQGVFLIFTVFSGRRFLFSLPAPSPLPLTGPISSSLRRKFQHGARNLRVQRKRLHCRLLPYDSCSDLSMLKTSYTMLCFALYRQISVKSIWTS